MSQVPTLEATPMTDADREQALKAADFITVELINNVQANPPALQSAKVVAAATFKQINGMLQTLKTAYADAPIDCSTTAGDKAARDIRLRFKTLRTRSNKLRLDANAPYVEQIEANGDLQKMIEDAVLPLEQRYDAAIKAQEELAAQRKRDADAIAAERAKKVADALSAIVAMGNVAPESTSAEIAVAIQELTIMEVAEADFDHRFGEAIVFKDQAIARLESARALAQGREDREKQADEERAKFAAERGARVLIANVIDTPTSKAQSMDVVGIRNTLNALSLLDAEGFAPLVDEGRDALERSIQSLTTLLDLKTKQAAEATAAAEREQQQAAEQAKRDQEQAARDGIAKMQSDVAKCVTASSASIFSFMEEMNALNLSTFEPLAREAAEVQEECLKSMELLRAAAQDREESVAERNRKQLIADNIEKRINVLRGIAARAEAEGIDSKAIDLVINSMSGPTTDFYGDRVEEATTIIAEQRTLLTALRDTRKTAEDTAAAEKAERERVAADKAAADARRSRTVLAMAHNSPEMFGALAMVLKDEGFVGLTEATRVNVITLLKKIETAING